MTKLMHDTHVSALNDVNNFVIVFTDRLANTEN